ncbi:hypothetical protein [Antribacter gilvus]|uniref:hypothetical protein n=1 Tax=Antribacter gilvus TaxID=2304675 RepID=UPI001980CB28|nr:hypothetical protein [Antribacter gilvus]
MTLWDLFELAVRRWPVVLCALAITAGMGWVSIQDDGVYWSRTQVVFLAPLSEENPNALRTQSESLIITAGLVAKEVNGPGEVTKYGSPEVTLVGLGVREGWSVRQPDVGGQWAPNFNQQVLYLEVVGPTPAHIQAQQDAIFDQIAEELDILQRELEVHPVNHISVTIAPESTAIYHATGSRPRALMMTTVLCGAATVALLFALEMRARRRWLREQRDTPTTAIPIVQARPPWASAPGRSADELRRTVPFGG